MSEVKRLEADVVVIAGGMSGLCASIAAAEKGASVIVFEKGGTVGGAANMGMGFFGVESHIQKRQLDSLTVDQAFKMIMEYNHWRADPSLIHKLYEQSGDTIKWVEDMGLEWLGAFRYFKDSQATWHVPKVPGSNKPVERSASLIVKTLSDRAHELGVEFRFYTPVYEIIREGNRVSGVRARGEDGTEYEADCDAVIVCTGGFGDNPEMIKEYLGYEHGEQLFSFRIPGLKGDGMKMAWSIGAAKGPIGMEMTYESPSFSGGCITDVVMRQPNLMVNFQGKRFLNEEVMINTPHTGNAICRQYKSTGFSIVTDEVVESYRKKGLDFVFYHKPAYTIDDWQETVDNFFNDPSEREDSAKIFGDLMGVKDPNMRFFFRADSMEELCEQTGIDYEGFKATIESYNAMCTSGQGDTQFGKDNRYMKPMKGKTWYAMRYMPSGYGSLGGIMINDMLQVIDDEHKPIPGLYAAGTDTCSIFGDTYCFYLPGSTMGYAVNSGRMAGYNAVDYIDSDDFVED